MNVDNKNIQYNYLINKSCLSKPKKSLNQQKQIS